MNTLNLYTQNDNSSTMISNEFIDNYMPYANGEFVKLYVYLLRCVSDNQTKISLSALADFFNQTDADIVRALKYWDKVGAIVLSLADNGHDIEGITFCNLNTAKSSAHNLQTVTDYAVVSDANIDLLSNRNSPAVKSVDTQAMVSSISAYTAKKATDAAGTTSTAYTPSQLDALSSDNEEFKMITYAVGTYLGCMLNPQEASTVAYLYDTLHFSADLIDFLVEYCVTKGKKSMRYIEKVALAWADAGITSVAEAKEAAASHKEVTYSVLNAFGITGRTAGKYEQDYISKWTNQFGFDTDIIIEACDRTLRATHQPSFEYADSILSKWQAANVKSAQDIKQMDLEFEQASSSRFAKRAAATVNKTTNRFNNFSQRDTDIDSLESSLISNNG